jgi:hypothetical protein
VEAVRWLREAHEALYIDEYAPDRIFLYPGAWLERDSLGNSCIARLSISIDIIEHVAVASDAASEVWVWRDFPAAHCLRLKP